MGLNFSRPSMNHHLLQPTATITAALITNPAPGVSKTKIEDIATLFTAVYHQLAAAATADAAKTKAAATL